METPQTSRSLSVTVPRRQSAQPQAHERSQASGDSDRGFRAPSQVSSRHRRLVATRVCARVVSHKLRVVH